MKKFYYIFIAILCVAISSVLYFTNFDNKVHDIFLSSRPSLSQENNFVLINIDDRTIDHEGFFPLNRNVYGNILFLLKEMNTNTAVFDLSFYDNGRDLDADEYFSKCIKLFENVYLGTTVAKLTDSQNEEDYNTELLESKKSIVPFAKILDDSIIDSSDICLPPIENFENVAKGTGFVSANDDKDGYLRRINLVTQYNDKIHGQLMFNAFLNYYNNPEVLITNNHIVLKNIEINGIIKDIKIPRSENGSFILKYPKNKFKDYNIISAAYLLEILDLEADLNEEIEFLNDLDFFNSVPNTDNPFILLNNLKKLKNTIINSESDDLAFEDYLVYKQKYYDSIKSFLTGNFIDWIFQLYTSEEDKSNIVENFAILEEIYNSLLKERQELKSIVENTICTIGTAASSTGDYSNNFYETHSPSFAIHQVIANMIQNEDFTDDCKWWISLIIGAVLSILIALISMFVKNTKKQLFYGISIIILLFSFLYVFFAISNIYINVVEPLVSCILTFIVITIIEYVIVHKEKNYVINAFGHYLSKSVVNEILKDPSKLNLGGEDKELTAMFTDIKKFTTICDRLGSPQKVVKLLNKYLTRMSNIILEHNGTIDKFEGDAIICFFGAPITLKNHAELACKVALEIKKAEIEINEELLKNNETPLPLFTRIGINTGIMTVGNMGTDTMMNYTIMGNNVNLASRLEGINKRYNTRGIIISEYTKKQIGNKFLVRSLENVLVVGSETPIKLYELLAENNNAKLSKYVDLWEESIKLFESRNYEQSLESFSKLKALSKNDGVLDYFIKQTNILISNPPSKDWDGVFRISEK